MSEQNRDEQSTKSNEIAGETGQLDTRFVLWRAFCAESGVSVETLPSELSGEAKERWEKMKDSELHPEANKK